MCSGSFTCTLATNPFLLQLDTLNICLCRDRQTSFYTDSYPNQGQIKDLVIHLSRKEKKSKRCQPFWTKGSQIQSLCLTHKLLDEKSKQIILFFFPLWLICTLWKLGVKRREQRETYSGLTTISASTKLKESVRSTAKLLQNQVKERPAMKSQLNEKEAKKIDFGKH